MRKKRKRKRNKEEEEVAAMEKLNLRDDNKKSLKVHSDHPVRGKKKKLKALSPRPGLNGSLKKKKKGTKKKAA